MNDSLAILLPVQNAQATLVARVRGVLEIAAELTPRCEIAIIDDGSTDGTEEIACDLALEFPQVLVARHHRPRGVDEAIHTGAQATHGSILMIVPPQTELQPNELRRLWRIATGGEADQPTTGDMEPVAQSHVMSRLVKWGQALREESARHQIGPQTVRREWYRRRKSAKWFQPSRIDAEASPSPTAPPNFLTQLRDFALGE